MVLARREYAKLLPAAQPVDNPLEEFQKLAGRVLAWADLIESKLAELTDDQWVTAGYETGQQIHPVVALFQPALAECRQTLAAFARLNIEERLTKIEEAKLAQWDVWLAGLLEAAALPSDQEARVLSIIEARWHELEK